MSLCSHTYVRSSSITVFHRQLLGSGMLARTIWGLEWTESLGTPSRPAARYVVPDLHAHTCTHTHTHAHMHHTRLGSYPFRYSPQTLDPLVLMSLTWPPFSHLLSGFLFSPLFSTPPSCIFSPLSSTPPLLPSSPLSSPSSALLFV